MNCTLCDGGGTAQRPSFYFAAYVGCAIDSIAKLGQASFSLKCNVVASDGSIAGIIINYIAGMSNETSHAFFGNIDHRCGR